MRLSPALLPAAIVLVAANVTTQPVLAAPKAAAAKQDSTFVRNAPLPKWIAPLSAVPPAVQTGPVVLRLMETQAWAGPKPVVLVNRAVQVNDKSKLGEIGQYSLPYRPAYEKLSLHRVAILRGDTVLDRTATVNIRLLEQETSVATGFYMGVTSAQLLLDDVRVGDTLQIVYSTEGANPVFGSTWTDDYQWDRHIPQETRKLLVSHPAATPLHWREVSDAYPPGLAPVVERIGNIERLRFEGQALAPFSLDEGVPNDVVRTRMLQFSEYGSWQQVAQWANALFAPAPPASTARPAAKKPEAPSELVTLAQRFAGGANDTERASAALRWVQDEIRYFSVALGENSHRPQVPGEVLRRRFGDCKDKSVLLIALLAQMGIKAEPVLVNAQLPTYPRKSIAAPTVFDHAIVRVHLDGKTYFVDPTRVGEKALIPLLPTAVPGAAGLVVAPDTTDLIALPEEVVDQPVIERLESFVLDELDGDARLKVRISYRGNLAAPVRAALNGSSQTDLAKNVLADFDKLYPGAELVEGPTLEDSADGTTFSVLSGLRLPKPILQQNSLYVMRFDSKVLNGLLRIPGSLTRTLPLQMPMGRFQTRYRMQVQWPQRVKMMFSEGAVDIDNPFFDARQEFSWRGNELDYTIDYATKRAQVPAAEVPQLGAAVKNPALQSFGEGNVHFHEAFAINVGAEQLTVQDAIAMRNKTILASLGEAIKERSRSPMTAEVLGLKCAAVRHLVTAGDGGSGTLRYLPQMIADVAQQKGFDKERDLCLGQVYFSQLDYARALETFAKTDVKEDDAALLKQAWTRMSLGNTAAAAGDAGRYAKAKLKQGKLLPSEAIQVALVFQHAHQPLPPDLQAYVDAVPDGAWPRPVLAYLAGKISQQALLDVAREFGPVKREMALNEAWFAIGSNLRAQGNAAEAIGALNYVADHGLRGFESTLLARSELALLTGTAAAAK